MRRSSWFVLAAFAATVLGVVSTAALNPKISGVSADIVTTYSIAGGRQVTTHGRYYRSQDGQVREDSGLGAIIADTKQRTLTMLNSERKEAIVLTMPAQRQVPPPGAMRSAVPIGDGNHQGRAVTKVRIPAAGGKAQEVWTAKDIGLVVFSKLETSTTTTTKELRNVSLAEPDASLFTVPDGYSVRRETLPETFAGTPTPAPRRGQKQRGVR